MTCNGEQPPPPPPPPPPPQRLLLKKLDAIVVKIGKTLVSCSPKRRKLLLMFLCYMTSNATAIRILFLTLVMPRPMTSGWAVMAPCISRYAPNLPSVTRYPQIIGANLLNKVHLHHIAWPFQSPLLLKTFRFAPLFLPQRGTVEKGILLFTYPILRVL